MAIALDNLPDDPETLKAMIAELQSANTNMQSLQTALEAEVATLSAANTELHAANTDMQSSQTALEAQVAALHAVAAPSSFSSATFRGRPPA